MTAESAKLWECPDDFACSTVTALACMGASRQEEVNADLIVVRDDRVLREGRILGLGFRSVHELQGCGVHEHAVAPSGASLGIQMRRDEAEVVLGGRLGGGFAQCLAILRTWHATRGAGWDGAAEKAQAGGEAPTRVAIGELSANTCQHAGGAPAGRRSAARWA